MKIGGVLQRASTVLNFMMVPGVFGAMLRAPRKSVPSLSLVGTLKAMGVRANSVIDVGANTGQFTSACLAYFPDARIIAVEALPAAKVQLDDLLAGYPNVTVVGKGCGSKFERRVFHANKYAKSSSFLELAESHKGAFPEATRTTDIEVEIVTLDSIVDQHSIKAPDLLKLDVQGFEMEVLKGAVKCLQGTRYILTETSFAPLYKDEPLFLDYVRFLAPYGFVFRGPAGFLTDPRTGVYLQMDALFERTPS